MEYLIPAILGVSLISLVIFLRWLRKNDDYFEKRGLPYDPRPNLITFLRNFVTKTMHEIILESYKKHGRIYGSFLWRKPMLTVCEPDLLRDVLVKDFNIFNSRIEFEISDPLFNKILTVLKGDDWKRVRTIITPAFTSKRMRQMSHIINECSQTVVNTLGKYADRKETVDVKSIFGAFTMDVIASAAFATKINSHDDPNNIFVRKVKEGFEDMGVLRILAFFVLPQWITNLLNLTAIKPAEFFKDVIVQVVKERRETGKRYDDILQLLLDAQDELEKDNSQGNLKVEEDETDQFGSITSNSTTYRPKYKRLSEDELVAQCILFFLVGYETTASTLSYLSYCLALNPECQDKLIAEVDEAYEKHKKFDYDVTRDMKYLDCVLSETLRLYPALTRAERTASEDYKLGNTGITIEKDTIVAFNIQAMHLDPEFFPNPEKFEPERFMDENVRHPQYAYLPFGAGPRNCLGMRFAIMEIKLAMCNILRHYRFKKAATTKVPLEFRKGQGLLMVYDLPLMTERRVN